MNWVESLKNLHSAQGISEIVSTGGLLALMLIIFAETGLLAGFFLPGDSLLITAGLLSNPQNPNYVNGLNILSLNFILTITAIIGDQVGFFLGTQSGKKIYDRPDGRFYKRAHLESAREFYIRYGGPAIAAGRYIPIIRTFIPFVAGIAMMDYKKFVLWNIAGGIIWVTSMLWIGYYLGQTALANRLDKIIIIVIFVSTIPLIISAVKKYFSKALSHISK